MNCFDPRGSREGRVSIFLFLRGTKLNVSENGGMNSIFEEQNPHFILEPSKTTTLKDLTFLFMTERFYHIMDSASNNRLRHEVLLNHNSTVKPPSPRGCKGGSQERRGGWGGGIIAQ